MNLGRRGRRRKRRRDPSYVFYIADNLPVLRGLDSNSVHLIYLKPPRYTGEIQRGSKESSEMPCEEARIVSGTRAERLDEITASCPDALCVIASARRLYSDLVAGYLTGMAVRLVEMERVMKHGGSIYLHCDQRISHLLRTLMDAVFGPENFKNELILQVPTRRAGGRKWPLAHETLLFYTGPAWHRWRRTLLPYGAMDWDTYPGQLQTTKPSPLTKAGLVDDDRGEPWDGYDPSRYNSHWVVPNKWVKRLLFGERALSELSTQEKLDLLDKKEMIVRPYGDSPPRYTVPLKMADPPPVSDVITHFD